MHEICLLTIIHGEWVDVIRCKRDRVLLEHNPTFEALSYAWGDTAITTPIVVDGEDFQVTLNLESALRRLRNKEDDRVIWIDQLCIDQRNEDEKSQQVGYMAEIFGAAQRVFIWLGDDEETSGTGFTLPARSVEEAEKSDLLDSKAYWDVRTATIRLLEDKRLSDWEKIATLLYFIRHLASNEHLVDFPIFPSVTNLSHLKTLKEGAELLLKKRWWNRIWVVQETLLAKEATVVLGSWVLPWNIFVSAAINFYQHMRSPCCSRVLDLELAELQRLFHGAIWTIAGTLSYAVERPPPEDELLYLLWAFRFKQATDDRDKVFGVLSLNKSASLRHGIVPNYSLGTLQLYLQVVEKHIEATSTLHSIVNWRPRRTGVPTWLPDWASADPDYSWTESINRNAFYTFYCAWRSKDKLDVTISDKILRCTGILVGTISAVPKYIALSGLTQTIQMLSEWRSMANVDKNPDKRYTDIESWQDAFSRTVIGDILLPADRYGYRRARKEEWEFFGRWWRIKTGVEQQTDEHKLFEVWDAAVQMASQRQSFFLTEEGYMGTGPLSLVEGDQVYVLKGSNVPFILRPVNRPDDAQRRSGVDGDLYCTMVGDCYCHGMMDGEAIRKLPEQAKLVSIL